MRHWVPFICSLFVLASAANVSAQEKTDPKEIVIGVAIINMNSEYVVLEIDGETWNQYFFEDDGMTLVVEGLDRTGEHVFSLAPIYEELKPVELTIKPKDWKLVRLDRETRQWQVKKTVKFRNWKPGEKEKLEAEKKKKEEAEKKEVEKKEPEKKEPEKKEVEKKAEPPAGTP